MFDSLSEARLDARFQYSVDSKVSEEELEELCLEENLEKEFARKMGRKNEEI